MDDEKLIPRLRALYPQRDTTGFNYFDLLHAEGSPLAALFYSRLFWPEFVEYDGMVFLKETVEDDEDRRRIDAAMAKYGQDSTSVEKVFNLVEVPSLFGRRIAESSDDDDMILTVRMASMWRSRLAAQFPDRSFEVSVVPASKTGGEVAILFHQTSSPVQQAG